MRRVALVVPGFELGGGVPAVALFLERVLRQSGRFETDIISLPTGSQDPASIRITEPRSWFRGVQVQRDRSQGFPFTRVGARWSEIETQRCQPRPALTALLSRYDLIQVVAGGPSWALAARGAGRPIGLQVATLAAIERQMLMRDSQGALRLWRHLMTRRVGVLERRGLALADAVFVENRWMFDLLRKTIPDPERVIFAPPGVDTDRFRPRSGGLAHDGPLLCVGRFADPRKQVGLLFEAYRHLRDIRGTAPPLILAGSTGPNDADWARADRLCIREHIHFHERVSDDELVRLYQEASLFVLSSDEEGLGIVILEAMASGVPVVATDCGGPTTSVREGETGYIVPRGDATALASRMATLLDDPVTSARLGREARRRAVSRFSLEASGRLFLEWYDRVLGDSRSCPQEHKNTGDTRDDLKDSVDEKTSG